MKIEDFNPAAQEQIRRQLNGNNRLSKSSVIERTVCNGPLAEKARETGDTGRVSIRVTSHRKKLADPDNLCAKWFVDCLRYCKLIRDDTAAEIEYTITQRKIQKGEIERTEIQICEI